jgi:hypothetical protein
MSEYKNCKITKHRDGTFSVEGSNLCDTALGIYHRGQKWTLEEVHKAIDEAEAEALAILESGKQTAEQIIATHKEIETYNAKSEENGRKAVQSAITAGKLLRGIKDQLAHGKWLPWLVENCKSISEKTAQNYMRLADPERFSNPQYVADLDECTSLRQAYLLTGICKLPTTVLRDDQTSKDVRAARATTTNQEKDTETKSTITDTTATRATQTPAGATGFSHAVTNSGFSIPLADKPALSEFVASIMEHLSGLTNDDEINAAVDTLTPCGRWYIQQKERLAEIALLPIAA